MPGTRATHGGAVCRAAPDGGLGRPCPRVSSTCCWRPWRTPSASPWRIYSDLYRHVLDVFDEYGVPIMTTASEGDPAVAKVVPLRPSRSTVASRAVD